jgi:hypothetical protein
MLRRKGMSLRLLHDVRQFMRDQLPAAGRMGLILSLAKDQPFSDGKGAGVHSACRLCRLASNVNAGTAEIVTEAGLHKCTGGRVKRLTGGTDDVAHDWGSFRNRRRSIRRALQFLLFGAFGARAAAIARISTGALALQLLSRGSECRRSEARVRHTQYLLGDTIGFLLVLVAGVVNGQLGLKGVSGARELG